MKTIRNFTLAAVAAMGISVAPAASAATFDYTGTLDTCGGLCIALGGLFGITTGSPLTGTYDNATGDFAGIVGTGGSSGTLDWDTAAGPWALNSASAGLTDDGSAITGGFLAIDNFGDAGALASLIVFVSGSGPQDFGVAGGAVADWVAYLPNAMGAPDPASLVAAGSGSWSSTVVPVPAAVWLFGSALLGMLGLRRRA